MKHLYLKYQGPGPVTGDVAFCGHVLDDDAPSSEEMCPVCGPEVERRQAKGTVRSSPDRETEAKERKAWEDRKAREQLSSLDTAITSSVITKSDLSGVTDAIEMGPDEDEDWHEGWPEGEWKDDPILVKRWEQMTAALTPGSAWWPLVQDKFADARDVTSEDEMEEVEEWAKSLFADPSEWDYFRGGKYEDLTWDAWSCMDLHEGSGFILVTASDGSVAFEYTYLL